MSTIDPILGWIDVSHRNAKDDIFLCTPPKDSRDDLFLWRNSLGFYQMAQNRSDCGALWIHQPVRVRMNGLLEEEFSVMVKC